MRRSYPHDDDLSGVYSPEHHQLAAFDVAGVTKIVASGGEQYRAVREDGRWDRLRGIDRADEAIYGVASLDAECRPEGHYRYTIGIKASMDELRKAGLQDDLFSIHIPAADWIVFTLRSFGRQYGDFWRDDPYVLVKRLGWSFDAAAGLHIDRYAALYSTDDDSMQFMMPVTRPA